MSARGKFGEFLQCDSTDGLISNDYAILLETLYSELTLATQCSKGYSLLDDHVQ